MSDHESSISKGVERPIPISLPEHLKKDTLRGMMPNEVGYFFPYVLKYDVKSASIYIDNTVGVTDEAKTIEPYVTEKRRIAVMPVQGVDGDTRFVIDATGAAPGDIESMDDMFFTSFRDRDEWAEEMYRKFSIPAAIAFKDVEGETELFGDPNYFDDLRHLIATYDAALNNTDSETPHTGETVVSYQRPEDFWG